MAQKGFRIWEIDFTDLAHSPYGYNPLRFIRYHPDTERYCTQDIITVAAALVPVKDLRDSFWELAARNLLETLIGYTLECLPPSEHNLTSVIKLFSELETGILDQLMEELCTADPTSFTATRWKNLQNGRKAERTYSSIAGILNQKLSNYNFDGAQALFTNPNQIDFAAISHELTAVFLKVSDNDSSLVDLTSLFYTQALQNLLLEADSRPDNRLQIPVRLYLDDFANLMVPDMDKTISIIRSREISVSLVLQSISQLTGLYGHAKAMTIIDNCDHLLYLGGQSLETAQFIAAKADKTVSTILNLPLNKAWLFQRGSMPREVQKYDITHHPYYSQLLEASNTWQWAYQKKDMPFSQAEPLPDSGNL